MRTSRMAAFGGSSPPLNPSMNSEPPLGPADGPAKACKSASRSSGSSESASRSAPVITSPLALLDALVLSAGAPVSSTVTFSTLVTTLNLRSSACAPGLISIVIGCASERSGAVASTVNFPADKFESEYTPSRPETADLTTLPDAVKETVACGTTAPDSSVITPCRVAGCAATTALKRIADQTPHQN